MDFTGCIIEESLENKEILESVNIVKTRVEEVTAEHKTPWIKQWTLHTFTIPDSEADSVAKSLSKALDSKHNWYSDFKNDKFHYIIFRNKVFKVDRAGSGQYADVVKYGISLGIPEYQLDFSPDIK